jgi:hypothetical protein
MVYSHARSPQSRSGTHQLSQFSQNGHSRKKLNEAKQKLNTSSDLSIEMGMVSTKTVIGPDKFLELAAEQGHAKAQVAFANLF